MPISLTSLDVAYGQNFDTLANTAGSTTNNLALLGWLLTETGGGARDNEQYAADNGGSNTGDAYSYGAAGSTDRALGGLRSGTLIPVIGASFTNNTGSTITSLDIAYIGEQWRLGTPGRADQLTFEYSTDATDLATGTWTGVAALNFSSPDTATTGAKNGNATSTALSTTITGLNIAPGATFFIRWTDTEVAGADDGLAVDNFSLTPHGAPATPTVSISDASISEGDNGTTVLTFTVTRSDNSTAFSVDYTTLDGTATIADSDYVAVTGAPNTIQFTAGGALSQDISITINGDLTSEPNETFTVNLGNLVNTTGTTTIADGTATGTIINDDFSLTPIYTIQGAGHFSAFDGQTVTTRGIVTARFSNGFYIQDALGDGNVNTSDGIFVFTSSAPNAAYVVGADVTVVGTVDEFQSSGRTTDLTLTEIVNPTVTLNGIGALPAAVVLGDGTNGTRAVPLVSLGDSVTTGTYDPATQGTDFYESLEGMVVTIRNAVTSGPFRSNFGEIVVSFDAGANPSINSRGGVTITDTTPDTQQPADKVFDFNPERLQLDDRAGGSTPVPTATGDRLGDVTGVLSYEFGAYDLNSTANVSIVTPSTLTRETTTIVSNLDRIRTASFNVENLAPVGQTVDGVATTQAKFNGLADAIINNLGAPEIIALQEVLDNDGETNSATVSASTTLSQLVDTIVARGGPRYIAIDSVPVDDQVGGIPGGNQRVAYLYLADAVTPTARNNLTTLISDGNGPKVLEAPQASQIGQGNPDFNATRKSLPMEWAPAGYSDALGGTFYTVDSHFSSKGGSAPLYGNLLNLPLYADPLNGAAQSSGGSSEREGQAETLNAYIDSILGGGLATDNRIVALGDFNDFQFFPVIDLITGRLVRTQANPDGTPSLFDIGTAVMAELADKLPAVERYSYNFDGNSQQLDQILISNALYASTLYDIVHINSEFATQISDHDPSVASLLLPRSAAIATSGDDVFDQAAYTAKFGATRGSLAGSDTIEALDGNDRISAGGGNDAVDGGANGAAGDTAVFTGARTDYTVTDLGNGAFQLADNRGGSPDGTDTVSNVEKFEFTSGTLTAAQLLAVDATPPALTGSSPADNATDVAIGANIVLTFDEAVQAGTGNIVLHPATGADISIPVGGGQVVFDAANKTVTINPTADLRPGVAYDVIIGAGVIKDTADNAFAGVAPDALDFTTSFTIPAGTFAQNFTVSDPGTFTLLAGSTRTQTAGTGVAATVSTGSTTIDIEGRLIAEAGVRPINAVLVNGQIIVGANGLVQSTNQDAIRAQAFGGANPLSVVSVTNLGEIVALSSTNAGNVTVGGSGSTGHGLQYNAATGPSGATDYTSGGTVTNGAVDNTTATIKSSGGEAIRLGSNITVTNYGKIIGDGVVNDSTGNNGLVGKSTTNGYPASRGIEVNSGSHVKIDNHGSIEGAQHAVDIGNAGGTDIVVNNFAGGSIVGHNGSGVGSDTSGASATTVVVVNAGTIRGESNPAFDRAGYVTVDGDGDGVDVDGGATITNMFGGTISGVGASGFDTGNRANRSEGISIGGGSITNDGTISGADYGVTVNNDGNANRSGVLAATITNNATGTITGLNGFAIRLENKAGSAAVDNDSIVNFGTITGNGAIPDPNAIVFLEDNVTKDGNTDGTLDGVDYTGNDGNARFIRGDGAAIQMGEGDDALTNHGAITGNSGRAISMEGGTDTLTLHGGGTITGRIDGGTGTDTVNLLIGSGTGTLADVINVEALSVQGGTWTVSDVQAYANGVTVSGGLLRVDGSLGASTVEVNAGTLGGNGTVGAVTVASGATLSPGASAGTLRASALTLSAGATFTVEIGGTAAGIGGYDQVIVNGVANPGGALDVSLIGGSTPATGDSFTIIQRIGGAGTFDGLAEGATFSLGSSKFSITYAGGDGDDVVLRSLNDAPALGGDNAIIVPEGGTVTITAADLTATDPDSSDAQLLFNVTATSHGSVLLNGAVTSSFTKADIAAGIVSFKHDGGESNGSFSVALTDGTDTLPAVTVTATVNPHGNDAPVIANAIADQSSAEDAAWTFQVPANAFSDIDGDTLTYAAALDGGAALPAWLSFATGTRTFSGTPPQNFNGPIDIKVTASDGTLTVSDSFRLNVTPVNDAPVVSGGVTLAAIIQGSGARVITQAQLLANASDGDGPSLTAINLQISEGLGALVNNGNGTWTYTPVASDSSEVSFAYAVTDGSLTAPGTAKLDILPVTSAPPIAAGTPGNDSFTAPAGEQRFDAIGGIDTIKFGFKLTDAKISFAGNTVVVDGPTGSHTVLTGFEVFEFTDGTVHNDDANPLVDDLFYYSKYHDVWNSHIDAEQHYDIFGWHEGRDPDAFFSTTFYLSLYRDVKAAGLNPLTHFDTFGWKEGRLPSSAFSTADYLKGNADVAAAKIDPLAHFLQYGAGEGRQPVAVMSQVASDGFDWIYYLRQNPDVQKAEVDPHLHFNQFGWKEGRNPNAFFDTKGYLATYADVKNAGANPLLHYHQNGWTEGRDPSVNFDTTAYLDHYADVKAAHVNASPSGPLLDPLVHFLQFGQAEGRLPFGDGIWG